ncbi:hypothetical protein EB001_22815 [bacterium]|nr:hypothetical protein [bacterium]
MTPKEKASELFDKYYRLFNSFPNYQYVLENLNIIHDEKLYTAKQCALIAVDEILHITSKRESWFNVRGKYNERFVLDQYWVEVKQEICSL